jgi:transposase
VSLWIEIVRVYVARACFTAELYAMADWLKQCRIETVAMESTGVYWIPVFQVLESRGFEVKLVFLPITSKPYLVAKQIF